MLSSFAGDDDRQIGDVGLKLLESLFTVFSPMELFDVLLGLKEGELPFSGFGQKLTQRNYTPSLLQYLVSDEISSPPHL